MFVNPSNPRHIRMPSKPELSHKDKIINLIISIVAVAIAVIGLYAKWYVCMGMDPVLWSVIFIFGIASLNLTRNYLCQ